MHIVDRVRALLVDEMYRSMKIKFILVHSILFTRFSGIKTAEEVAITWLILITSASLLFQMLVLKFSK